MKTAQKRKKIVKLFERADSDNQNLVKEILGINGRDLASQIKKIDREKLEEAYKHLQDYEGPSETPSQQTTIEQDVAGWWERHLNRIKHLIPDTHLLLWERTMIETREKNLGFDQEVRPDLELSKSDVYFSVYGNTWDSFMGLIANFSEEDFLLHQELAEYDCTREDLKKAENFLKVAKRNLNFMLWVSEKKSEGINLLLLIRMFDALDDRRTKANFFSMLPLEDYLEADRLHTEMSCLGLI